jgi:hypothetical protein
MGLDSLDELLPPKLLLFDLEGWWKRWLDVQRT